jgi:DNA-binding response OmpR family regulator
MAAHVVVIDDDTGMCESLKDLLALEQFECSTAENAKMGLSMIKAERPQLVVLDLQLPDMSGFQLCQMLKKDPLLRDIPVIMISGRFTEKEDRLQGFDLGADEYFAKPFDPTFFVARIKNILRDTADPASQN